MNYRERFALMVFGAYIMSMLVSFIQWILFREHESPRKYFCCHTEYAIFYFIGALACTLLLTHFDELRLTDYLNIIFLIVALELFTLTASFVLMHGSRECFITVFAVVLISSFALIVVAYLLYNDFTMWITLIIAWIVILFLCVLVFAVYSICMKEDNLFVRFAFAVIAMILFSFLQLSLAQIVQGGRYLEFQTDEAILA